MSASATSASSLPTPAHVRRVCDMGFDERQATIALQKFNNSLERAIEWLLSDAGRIEASVSPSDIVTKNSNNKNNGSAPSTPSPSPPSSSPNRIRTKETTTKRGGIINLPPNVFAELQQPDASSSSSSNSNNNSASHHHHHHHLPRNSASHASRSAAAASAVASSASAAQPARVSPSVTSAASLMKMPLPAGFTRGKITRFYDANKSGAAGTGYGFIQPDSAYGEDLYFQWKNVLSCSSPWPPTFDRFGEINAKMASEIPSEPFFVPDDIVAYRTTIQQNYVDKNGNTGPKKHAVDIRILEYSKNVKFRRTQAQVTAGENAPMSASHSSVATNPNAAASAASSASATASATSSSSSSSNALRSVAIPTAPFSSLVGTRQRGVIYQLSSDPDGKSKTPPYGFLSAHHVTNCTLIFFLADFRESKHAVAESNGAAAGTNLRGRIHIGDVLEYTVQADDVAGFVAKDISIIATLTYAQVMNGAQKQQAQDNIGIHPDIVTFISSLPPVYIQGSSVSEDESKHLEFKSLTRSASSAGMQMNLAKTSEKYMNSFLNSAGGIILFGVENDGLVVGLGVNKKERDQLRMQIDGFMEESIPRVSSDMYEFRFIRAYRLYKSSWIGNGPNGSSLGSVLAQIHTPKDEILTQMLTPDPADRVEQLELYVIAIITRRGDNGVLYQTSGRGHASKESFYRRDGSTIRLTPIEIQERMTRNATVAQQTVSGIQVNAAAGITPELIASIVQQVKAGLAAAPSSSSSSSISATPQSVLPPSLPSSSSSTVVPATVDPAPLNDDFQVPIQLLTVLQSMAFSRGAILDACYSLHESRSVDFRRVFKAGSSEEENAQATNKVLNMLLEGGAPATRAADGALAPSILVPQQPQSPDQQEGLSHEFQSSREGEQQHPSHAPASLDPSELELEGVVAPTELPPQIQYSSSFNQQASSSSSMPHQQDDSLTFPTLVPMSASSSSSSSSVAAFSHSDVSDAQLPCELCSALCSITQLSAHQQECAKQQKELEASAAALAITHSNNRHRYNHGQQPITRPARGRDHSE